MGEVPCLKLRTRGGLLALGLVVAAACTAHTAEAPKQSFDFAVPAGHDSAVALVTIGKVPDAGIGDKGFRPGGLDVTLADGRVHKIGFELFSQWDEHEYVDYGQRGGRQRAGTLPPTTPYLNTVMRLNGLGGIMYYSLPKFNMSTGLYDHPDVERFMPAWRKVFPPWEARKVRFEFRTDAKGAVSVWLDGHFAGTLPEKGPVAALKATVLADRGAATFASETAAAESGNALALPPLPGRHNPDFGKDAKLVFDRGVKLPSVFRVWAPQEAIDMRRHRQTVDHYRFGWNPIYCRTPWDNGPEYMQWTIPCGFWTEAYVLCAVPEDAAGFRHVLGANLTRFGSSVNQSMLVKARTDLVGAATNADVRAVGRLETAKGSVPLCLVRLNLDVGRALDLVNDKPIHGVDRNGKWCGLSRMNPGLGSYLDFEFVGCGTQKSFPRTDVQIFGCLLVQSPYGFDMVQSERGNIFEGGEKPETGVEVVARRDGVKGSVGWKIWSDDWKLLKEGERTFELAKAGDRQVLKFDLAMPEVGWYGLDYEFRNEKGRVLATHEAAFALLGENDREAGWESPFAAWPQWPNGRHNCNPNREDVLKMMHKLGYHKCWGVPIDSEAESPHPEWQITLSSAHQYSNPPYWPKNGVVDEKFVKDVAAHLDKAVADYRKEFARYPHCEIIQLLHEQGYKDAAKELYTRGTLKPKALKGGVGDDFHVYWCTEFVKRMRKEFPDKKIQVGNGSSSSQMIAKLAANGFDLESVDYLGIESKGFSAMPEFADNRESPGMLWALRETGRKWGYTNFMMNACNEYVFRPERDIPRTANAEWRMRQADYTLRDFLISLAWGCTVISSGHLEDSNTDYYDTNWGAGAHCKFFPYSYPKRMFPALATLTKVFDKARFVRAFDTGYNSLYALEFARDRRKKDYAYAFWCNKYSADFALELPEGANADVVDWQGRRRSAGRTVRASSTPTYVISDKPVRGVRATPIDDDASVCEGLQRVARMEAKKMGFDGRKDFTAKLTARDVRGPGGMPAVEFVQTLTEPAPAELANEWARIWPNGGQWNGKGFTWSDTDQLGVWIRGNGSCSTLDVTVSFGDRTTVLNYGFAGRRIVEFDGWHFVRMSLPDAFKGRKDQFGRIVSIDLHVRRSALDPKEMAPVRRPLAVGDMYLVRNAPPAAAEKNHDMMRKVNEKDL